jgi:AAA15 family ATPase/GTPase
VLIQLYLIQRWLEPGGVVLIDEPDLHLHPSLIPGFLATLESLVAERKGQLFLTSHVLEIWDRYESTGRRIGLGEFTLPEPLTETDRFLEAAE